MKVKDVIGKQREYWRIRQARKELGLFAEKVEDLYRKCNVLHYNDTTSYLIESVIIGGMQNCREELKKQLDEMEV